MTISTTPAEPEKKKSITHWVADHPDRILIGLTVFTVSFALLFLILWIITNLFWAAEDAEQRSSEVTNPLTGAVLRVDYPAAVLANDRPVTFTFTVRNITDAVTLTASIPAGLRQIVTADRAIPLTLTVPITPTSDVGNGAVAFINAKVDRDIRTATCLDVAGSEPVSLTVKACFNVEGTWGYAGRNFINVAVTDKSPLIVLIVTFITGAGALLPGLLKQQAERNAKAQAEAHERSKNAAAEKKKLFLRYSVIDRDINAMQRALKELEDPELIKFSEADLPVMRSLIQLATVAVGTDLIALVKQTALWPDECAAAYLMAYQRLYKLQSSKQGEAQLLNSSEQDEAQLLNSSELHEAQNFIPIDAVSNKDVIAELSRVTQSLPYLQFLVWPLIRRLVVPDSLDPFQHEATEDDQPALFGRPNNGRRPAYWPGHPTFATLGNSERPQLVFGEPGSGRTAMSLALGKYGVTSGVRLSLYLPGQPTCDKITAGYARLLLDFIQVYPTHLSRLNSSDRSLLARVLIDGLGKEYVLAEIEAARRLGEWRAQPDLQSDRHLASLGNAQLDLLMREIGVMPADRLSETQWPWAINRCARALSFERKQVTLVIDSVSADPAWLTTFIAPRLSRWQQAGLVANVFVPQAIVDNGFKLEDGVTQVSSLDWSPDKFRTMLRYRYTNLQGPRRQIEEAFESQAVFDRLMHGSHYIPRNFVHLWQACQRATGERAKITATTLTAIFEREGIV